MASIASGLWVERYRPKSVSALVLPNDFKKFFKKIVEDGDIPNLLLSSPTPGTGKTSIAKAIVNDLEADYIYLNASSENSIDVIRTQIAGFAQTMSFTSGKKIVILDEADGLTRQFQQALRAYMEEFQSNCRFILTCNRIGQIIEPLKQGRTMVFDFDMSKYKSELAPQIVRRLQGILKNEGVEYAEGICEKIVERTFPSVRKAISFAQQYVETHGVLDENAVPKDLSSDLVKIFAYDPKEKPNVSATRLYIEQEGISAAEVYHAMFDKFVPDVRCVKKAQATILLAEYEYRTTQSADPSLQVAACLLELAGCWGIKRDEDK